MPIIASHPLSQVLGPRIRGMDAWQRQQERHAAQRTRNTSQENWILSGKTYPDQIARTNPNTMPTSEPRLNPTTETSSPSLLMPPHHRNIVLARAALAAGARENIYFGR